MFDPPPHCGTALLAEITRVKDYSHEKEADDHSLHLSGRTLPLRFHGNKAVYPELQHAKVVPGQIPLLTKLPLILEGHAEQHYAVYRNEYLSRRPLSIVVLDSLLSRAGTVRRIHQSIVSHKLLSVRVFTPGCQIPCPSHWCSTETTQSIRSGTTCVFSRHKILTREQEMDTLLYTMIVTSV